MEGGGEGRLKKSYAYIQDVTPERGGRDSTDAETGDFHRSTNKLWHLLMKQRRKRRLPYQHASFLSPVMNAERPHLHPAVTEDRKGTKHPKEDTNQGMQEVVIARVTANWLQRNTRDDSQDGAKREVVRERQKEEENEVCTRQVVVVGQ